MRNKILFGLTIVLVATLSLAAEEIDAAMQSPGAVAQEGATQVDVATLTEACDTRGELEPVSFKELAEGFRVPTGSWGNCGQSGACNVDRDCFWMRPFCPLGSAPECNFGTGSGCEGTCNCVG